MLWNTTPLWIQPAVCSPHYTGTARPAAVLTEFPKVHNVSLSFDCSKVSSPLHFHCSTLSQEDHHHQRRRHHAVFIVFRILSPKDFFCIVELRQKPFTGNMPSQLQ